MVKPSDYDDIKLGGNFRVLPKGGYICRILRAEETQSSSGKPMVHIAFDICDGEYSNYFTDLLNTRRASADDPTKVKYPFEGQKWIPTTDYQDSKKTSKQFKSFCTAIEDSGTEISWDANFSRSLEGATVGVIFRREEQEYNGKRSWRTTPWGFRSAETIEGGDYFIPEDKPLPDAVDDYVDGFSADESDIPF